jgi:hypothetical protein
MLTSVVRRVPAGKEMRARFDVPMTDSKTGDPFKVQLEVMMPEKWFKVIRVQRLPAPAPLATVNTPAASSGAAAVTTKPAAPAAQTPAPQAPAPPAAVDKPAAPANPAPAAQTPAPLAAVNKPGALTLKVIPPTLQATGDKPAARMEAYVHGGDEPDHLWEMPAPERDIQGMPLADGPRTGRGQAVME